MNTTSIDQPSRAERLQRSSFGPLVRTMVSLCSWPRWRLTGSPPPAPPHLKRAALAEYAERFPTDTFVETGTYRGDTLARMRPRFERSISIELDKTLAAQAQKRFLRYSDVEIFQGDSAEELEKVVATLVGPAMFFLDGHYSGGVTADSGSAPIVKELNAIFSSHHNHVVLVDDARLINGTNGYPTMEQVLECVRSLRPEMRHEIKDDIVRIHR